MQLKKLYSYMITNYSMCVQMIVLPNAKDNDEIIL